MGKLKEWIWDDAPLCVGILASSLFYLFFAMLTGRSVFLADSLFSFAVTGLLLFVVPVAMIVGIAVPMAAVIYSVWKSEPAQDNIETCILVIASSFLFCLFAEYVFAGGMA